MFPLSPKSSRRWSIVFAKRGGEVEGHAEGGGIGPVTEAGVGGEPGAGGSFAITQRWVHDLAAFHALSIEEQQTQIRDIVERELNLKETTGLLKSPWRGINGNGQHPAHVL